MVIYMNKALRLILVIIILASCQSNRLKIDVSGVDIKLDIKRLDRDIFSVTPDNNKVTIQKLRQTYDSFFDEYNENVIALGNPSDSSYASFLNTFLTDSMRVMSKLKIDSAFTDLTGIKNKLENGFRHYKFYFPDKAIPQVYTIISGFNQSVVMTDKAIGISLDNYLGAKCPFYARLALPEYKRENMYSGRIPVDVLNNWALSEFAFDESKNNLISNIVYQGKMLYFLDAMFPEEPDYVKIGYLPEKLEWCNKNEAGMWTYLVEHKLLFSTDRMNIVRFIGPAPFTSSFTNDSPGRAGSWIGWQIVRKYMKKNSDISLPALMSDNDYQKILNDSGYSPEY
jgi:gliding motility-associated lipoprotein GldB